jgi:ferritin
MRHESDEERGHALEFVDFAMKRNIPISLEELEAPASDWDTVEDLWAAILQAEMDNTQLLLVLGDAASQCNDHAVSTFLQPFHLEQINSEDNLRTILAKVQYENKTPGLLRQLDSELGQDTSGSSKS